MTQRAGRCLQRGQWRRRRGRWATKRAMSRVARVIVTATKRAMVRKRARALIRRHRLPPCHMPPLLLRLATDFRSVVAAALAHGGGDGGRFASTTTTCLGSTVEASSSASSTASPATSTKKNVVEHLSFKIVRTDDVPEYGAACIISCNIASDKCDPMRQM